MFTIPGTAISGNNARDGGAFYVKGNVMLTIFTTTIRNNICTDNGAAFYIAGGVAHITDVNILDNTMNGNNVMYVSDNTVWLSIRGTVFDPPASDTTMHMTIAEGKRNCAAFPCGSGSSCKYDAFARPWARGFVGRAHESGESGYQSGQHTVFSGTYMMNV